MDRLEMIAHDSYSVASAVAEATNHAHEAIWCAVRRGTCDFKSSWEQWEMEAWEKMRLAIKRAVETVEGLEDRPAMLKRWEADRKKL